MIVSVHWSSWFSGCESLKSKVEKDGLPDVSGCLNKMNIEFLQDKKTILIYQHCIISS